VEVEAMNLVLRLNRARSPLRMRGNSHDSTPLSLNNTIITRPALRVIGAATQPRCGKPR
jgi:hypothetical protein